MRFLWFLLPFVTLPLLATRLDAWRFLANRKASMTFEVAPAQLASAITLLLLILSFAITTACIIRRGWMHYATSSLYCLVGGIVILRDPFARMFHRVDTSMGTQVSDYLITSPIENLTIISWALLAGLGVILLIVEFLPTPKPSTGEKKEVYLY